MCSHQPLHLSLANISQASVVDQRLRAVDQHVAHHDPSTSSKHFHGGCAVKREQQHLGHHVLVRDVIAAWPLKYRECNIPALNIAIPSNKLLDEAKREVQRRWVVGH